MNYINERETILLELSEPPSYKHILLNSSPLSNLRDHNKSTLLSTRPHRICTNLYECNIKPTDNNVSELHISSEISIKVSKYLFELNFRNNPIMNLFETVVTRLTSNLQWHALVPDLEDHGIAYHISEFLKGFRKYTRGNPRYRNNHEISSEGRLASRRTI
uniref:Uncharacterized protein n=1 Tax=Glossina austeni TaxID=7395 RepID=A0A1A9V3V2_GLOAU